MSKSKFIAFPPHSIGQFEQLAGVEDRNIFWKPLIPIFQTQGVDAGMKNWRDKCKSLIRRRINSGQLTLLYKS